MKTHQVVPDVIDSEPSCIAKIKYASGVEMQGGNELTPTSVKDQPTSVQWASDHNQLCTLAFVDPDAPSRANPIRGEFLHWLVVNIPDGDLTAGETLAEYIGSGPPEGTGLHRYILLIYQQAGKLNLTDFRKITKNEFNGRPNFKIRNFAKQNQLGDPVAGNFYQAQYDDYVPSLHAQLKRN